MHIHSGQVNVCGCGSNRVQSPGFVVWGPQRVGIGGRALPGAQIIGSAQRAACRAAGRRQTPPAGRRAPGVVEAQGSGDGPAGRADLASGEVCVLPTKQDELRRFLRGVGRSSLEDKIRCQGV
jgi:hypothetical protein